MQRNTAFTILLLITIFGCNAQTDTPSQADQIADKEVTCFVYHRFGDSRYPSTNVSLKDFKAHLKYLKANDFQVLTFSDAIDYLNSDAEKQKTAVITIDDGYQSFYQNGLPLLQEHGYSATLFVNTKTVGGGDYMGWDAINDAIKKGIEIGNHTHSHAYFLNMPDDSRYNTFEKEVKLTQELIEKNTGSRPDVFAYPYGELDSKMKIIVQENGFKGAAAQNSGVLYHSTDLMQCPRFPMSEYYADPKKFAEKAEMKALAVISKTPESSILSDKKPLLTLVFEKNELNLSQLQCFIQGADCESNIITDENGLATLTLSPVSDISKRRRTLYTVTVPDKNGNWHWYSHLWVNPVIN